MSAWRLSDLSITVNQCELQSRGKIIRQLQLISLVSYFFSGDLGISIEIVDYQCGLWSRLIFTRGYLYFVLRRKKIWPPLFKETGCGHVIKDGLPQLALFLLCLLCITWFPPYSPVSDWGEDKIKATAAISSLLAPRQIGPLSNWGLIYQAKDGYWNCPTGHKSDHWIGLYLRQGRHHSVVAVRGERGRLRVYPAFPGRWMEPAWPPCDQEQLVDGQTTLNLDRYPAAVVFDFTRLLLCLTFLFALTWTSYCRLFFSPRSALLLLLAVVSWVFVSSPPPPSHAASVFHLFFFYIFPFTAHIHFPEPINENGGRQ